MLSEIELDKGGNAKALSRLSGLTSTKLEDLGITKYESMIWQTIARIPEDKLTVHDPKILRSHERRSVGL